MLPADVYLFVGNPHPTFIIVEIIIFNFFTQMKNFGGHRIFDNIL